LLRQLSRGPVRGLLNVKFGDVKRSAWFDARNRQFGAIYFDRYRDGYEPEVAALVRAFVGDAGVFYDIGSNWGYFSVLAAAAEGFTGRVYAFEPWPASFRDLQSIVEQLGLSGTIFCHNFALGERRETAPMTAGSHSGLAHITSGEGNRRAIHVALRSLDELGLEPPSLIKIDTEGHEEQVLRGGLRLLQTHRPMIVFEHRRENGSQWRSAGGLEFLEGLGYRLFVPRIDSAASSLELLDIDADSRAAHPDSGNLFACHAARLHELAQYRGNSRQAA
jgi:FkbM family methyltransferase